MGNLRQTFIAAELDPATKAGFETACRDAGLRMPSPWQQSQIDAALTTANVPNVLEQFDAIAVSRAVAGLDQIVMRPNTVFIAPQNRLPNWRNRFGEAQPMAALETLVDVLATPQPEAGYSAKGKRLAIVIPLVHPHGAKVQNYATIERILQQTVRSCMAQSHKDVVVIVLCHRLPDWADAFDDRLFFVLLGDAPQWTTPAPDVREDKGTKHLLGAQLALTRFASRAVMFLDGDDFLHRDFAKTTLSALAQGKDGLVITRGVHAALQSKGEQFALTAAINVDGFHHSCGSCRVFSADVLADRATRWWRDFLSADLFSQDHSLTGPAVADFFKVVTQSRANEFGLLRSLGRHRDKSMVAELTPLPEPLVAKGCGHGNHDGPRSGDIHWHRATGTASLEDIASEFSLDPRLIQITPIAHHWQRRARLMVPINRFKRLFSRG